MPIRPENRERYPADWDAISLEVKERAGWRCECEGECGRGTHAARCTNVHGGEAYGTGSRVVLTTAHLDHVPENCGTPGQRDNLKAMCQGCHLHYDREHHAETAYATRRHGKAIADLFAHSDRHEPDCEHCNDTCEVARNIEGCDVMVVCGLCDKPSAEGMR